MICIVVSPFRVSNKRLKTQILALDSILNVLIKTYLLETYIIRFERESVKSRYDKVDEDCLRPVLISYA